MKKKRPRVLPFCAHCQHNPATHLYVDCRAPVNKYQALCNWCAAFRFEKT